MISGLSGDGGSNNLIPVSNGINGFSLKLHKAYGSMGLTNNPNSFAVTAAVDPTLNTNSDYVLFTGAGAPWVAGTTNLGIAFSVDRLTVPATGVYYLDIWANIAQFPNAAGRIAIKYRVNGTTINPRKAVVKSNSAADYGNFSASGLATLNAGDYVQILFASSHTGGLIISDMNAIGTLVHAF